MKKFIILIGLTLFTLEAINAQFPQLEMWAIPPSSLMTFPFASPAVIPLPDADYNAFAGLYPDNAHNTMHDENGALLFYVAENIVYDKDGYTIGQLDYNPAATSSYNFTPEIAIVPDVEDCKKFYLITGFRPNTNFTTDYRAYYAVVDFKIPNPNYPGKMGALQTNGFSNGSIDGTLFPFPNTGGAFDVHSFQLHFAVSNRRQIGTGPKHHFVFIADALNIHRFILDANGISYDNNSVPITINSNGSSNIKAEMELFRDASRNVYKIATVGQKPNGPYFIYTADLAYNTGNLISGSERDLILPNPTPVSAPKPVPHGLEFSSNGAYLYITHETSNSLVGNIQYHNFYSSTPSLTSLSFPNSANYQFSHIELGHFLFGGLHPLCLISYGGVGMVYNANYPFSSQLFYPANSNTLYMPDQIDGEVYRNLIIECDTCCTDSLAFVMAAQNIQTNGELGDCNINVNGTGLPGCSKISWDFGDGPFSKFGPFADNTPVSYTFSSTNTYNVCYTVQQFSTSGDLCWEYTKCEEVFVICDLCCENYDLFCQRVMDAVSITTNNVLCKGTMDLTLLSVCDSIRDIAWEDNQPIDHGPYGSGDMPMHTFTASGSYIISYLAVEYDPITGLPCFEKLLYDTITVECDTSVIFDCGKAVVSCFAGFFPFTQTVNPNGPVLALVDVRNHATAPSGINWHAVSSSSTALYHLTDWESQHMGQVFGVTIDHNYNVYAAGSTIYGKYLPAGVPNNVFANVYRIDANDGAVTVFATLPQDVLNPAGLGDVWYDAGTQQVFVSNFHDGWISWFDLSGNLLGTYDFQGVNLGTPSAGFIPRGDRVWALATQNNRLYFSVWVEDRIRQEATMQNQIWSVALVAGIPTGTAFLEKNMPNLLSHVFSSPVSDISFSENGVMLLAERSMNNDYGDAYYQTGAQAHASRVFELSGPGWINEKIFYVGNGSAHYNSAGGIDYGYESFDPSISPLPTLCDSMIWGTGDALRIPGANNLLDASTIPCGGSTTDWVYGLAGVPQRGNSNLPSSTNSYVKTSSIYIDLDNEICLGDKTQIGDVDVFKNCISCPEIKPVPCDSLMVMIDPEPGNLCCYNVDIKNQFGPNISKLQLDLLTTGVIFNTAQISVANGFQFAASNSDQTICITHTSGSIPVGSFNDVLRFCYSGVNAPGEFPQNIKFTWWQNVGGSDVPTECMHFFGTDCPPEPVKDTCVAVTTLDVECNSSNIFEYILTFKVTNLSTIPAFNAYTVNLYGLPPGFSFSPCIGPTTLLNNISLSIPGAPLIPTQMSGNMCVKIVSSTPILSPQTICAQAKLIGLEACCTVDDKFCFTLEPCCNPCEEISITTTSMQLDSQCCHTLGLINNCPYPFFTKIEAEIITGGVTYGFYGLNTPYIGFWNIALSTNKKLIITPPAGGTIPGGSLSNLVSFCLDNINTTTQVPQQVVIRWIAPDMFGIDSIACDTILEFFCEPVIDYKCVLIDSIHIECLSGLNKYLLTFKVTNQSLIPFAATSLDMILLAPADLIFIPSSSITFPSPLSSGSSQVVSVCLWDLDGLPGGSNISFIPKLSFMQGDTCCFEGKPVTIPLPPCDTCACAMPSFTNMVMSAPGITSFNVNCETGYDNIGCPRPGSGFTLTGLFDCAGDSCFSDPYVYWNLVDPAGATYSGSSIGPYFGINLLPSYLAQPGIYLMKLTGFCNNDTCTCEFQFVVDCPEQCPCDIPDLINDVNQGFNYVLLPNSCQACLTPIALTDCDSVKWLITDPNGMVFNTSLGNNTTCITFPGSGTYTVFMEVTRRRPDGSICETFRKSQSVMIFCAQVAGCDDSVFPNPSFSEGAIPGGLNSGGHSDGWRSWGDPHEGEPRVVDGALGSLDGWTIQLHGNLDTGGILTTMNPLCLARDTGIINLRLRPRYGPGSGVVWARFFQGDSPDDSDCDSSICFEVARIDLDGLDPDIWYDVLIPYDLRNWYPADSCGKGVLVRPAIFVSNNLHSSQGGSDTYSVVQLDNLCVNGLIVAVERPFKEAGIRIYPNPTTGMLNLEMPIIPYADVSLQVMSPTGQQILTQRIESGINVQTIDVSTLPQGMYFLQIVSRDQVIAVNKFVKM